MKTLFAVIGGAVLGAGIAAGVFAAHERGHKHEQPKEPEEHSEQVTLWGDRHELFIEHPALVAGAAAVFVTHVTDWRTGEARAEGPVAFVMKSGEETPVEHVEAAPDRPGIYLPSLTFPKPGRWAVTVRIDDASIAMKVHVHATAKDAEHKHEAEAEGIRFLKEQQWKFGTRIEPVGKRRVVDRLRVAGLVAPRTGGRASLTPPVEGRLIAPPGRALPAVGERVAAGQVLALVQPPLPELAAKTAEAEAEIVRAKLALDQAEAVAARVRGLVAQKARSERELQDAEFALKTARASHEAAGAVAEAYRRASAGFELRSPIAGVVTMVGASAGEGVHIERPVFAVLDASVVHLEAKIPEADVGRVVAAEGVLYETLDARGQLVEVARAPKFLSPEVDAATRTVSLVYEVANAEGLLRVGMAVTLHVETSHAHDAIAVPESAIVDEEGRFVGFVQLGGESFEKRELTLGIRDGGFVQVLKGLEAGDRVVTKGAYAVRLASVATGIPAHGHHH